jgi:hypothetical protein
MPFDQQLFDEGLKLENLIVQSKAISSTLYHATMIWMIFLVKTGRYSGLQVACEMTLEFDSTN